MWQKACAGSLMPSRQSISPCHFSSLLPFVSLFEFLPNNSLKVVVAGSGLRDILGEDPKSAFLKSEIDGGVSSIIEMKTNNEPCCGVSKNTDIGRAGIMRFWMRLPIGFNNEVNGAIGLDLSLSGARAPIWALDQIRAAIAS